MNKLIKKAFTVSIVASTIVWSMGLAAFVPLANAAPVSGDLIKASLPSVYYYGADGKRYVFPNEKTYKTWYHDVSGNADFSAVKTITDSELAAISLAASNVTYKPGYKMVKVTTDPKVYAVDTGGKLRWVTSEAVASAIYGSTWNKQIDDVPDAFYANYDSTTGAAINAAADFDKAAKEAAAVNINTDKGLSAGAAGDLTISVKSKPAAGIIPASATVDFITYNVCAGGTAVNISKLSVKRTGLGADADFSGIKTYWDGNQKGSSANGDANHYFKFTYTTNVAIAANTCKELVIKGDIAAAANTGQSDELVVGIDAASAVTSTAATVSGTFPMNSNSMTINENTTIGSVTVNEGSNNPTTDYTINIDETNKIIHSLRLQAGSAENVKITQIYFTKAGSQDNDDATNWKLYNETDGTTIGTLTGFDADSHLVYNMDVTIAKGESKTFTLKTDVIDGTAHTVGVTSIDGSVWNIEAKGVYYGYGISPTATTDSWTGGTTTCPGNNGYSECQTINAGALVITKSAATPATGYIAPGATNLALFAFDAIVKGEPLSITRVEMTGALTTMTYDQLTNCSIYDSTGSIMAGPADLSDQVNDFVTWTDTFIMPVGTNTYTVKCNIASATATGDIVVFGFDQDNTDTDLTGDQNDVAHAITAKGTVSNNTVTPTPADTDITGNTMTVAAGSLAVVTQTTPPAQTVVVGVKGYEIANVLLDAGSSGEDVKITSITITNTTGAAAKGNDLTGVVLKVDGVQYGDTSSTWTLVSGTSCDTAGDNCTMAITLSNPIVVPKGTTKILKVYADIKGSAVTGATATHTINIGTTAAHLLAVGATTGLAVTEATSGDGTAQTVTDTGTLTTIISSADPSAKIVTANSTGVTWQVYDFKPNYENVRLDTLHLTLTAAADLRPENFTKFYLYNGTTKLAEAAASATPEFNNINFTMTANTNYTLTVKADLAQIGYGFAGHSGDTGSIDLGSVASDLDAVGLSSGAAVNQSAAISTGSDHYIYKTIPTFAKVTDSNTSLSPGIMETLRFTVTADANSDVIFSTGTGSQIPTWISTQSWGATAESETATNASSWLYNWDGNAVAVMVSDWTAMTDGEDTANSYPYYWDFTNSSSAAATTPNEAATVTISAGLTKTLYFKMDLTDWEDSGAFFRMEIKDDVAGDLLYWDNNDQYGAGNDFVVSGTPSTLIPGMPITGNTYIKT